MDTVFARYCLILGEANLEAKGAAGSNGCSDVPVDEAPAYS